MESGIRLPNVLDTFNLGSKYRINKLLGSGSFGNVVDACCNATGQRVAIKQVNRLFEDILDTKRLLREVSIMKTLSHPNIVKIIEILTPGSPENFNEIYIVMEYAISDLRKLIKSPVNFEEEHIKQISYDILCGMKYVHSAHVLHRDLKPANILVTQECEVKICDFGLARSLPELAQE